MTTAMNEFTISLPIADRPKSMAFYRDAFDFEPMGTPTEDGVPEPLQFRLDQRTVLLLIPTGGFGWVLGSRATASPDVSECLLSFTVTSTQEVEAIVERVRGAGGQVIAEPSHKDWGYTAICTDLDGHAWNITTASTADS